MFSLKTRYFAWVGRVGEEFKERQFSQEKKNNHPNFLKRKDFP